MRTEARWFVYAAAFLVLQVVFFTDLFGVHSENGIVQQDGSAMVLSRLSMTHQTGPFSYAGLPGWCGHDPYRKTINYQRSIYENGGCDPYTPYMSRSGLDALILEGLELFGANYDTFRYVSASVTSFAAVFLLAWAASEFGLLSALLALACMLGMRFFVLFGDNIALQPGLLLLTPLLVGWALRKGVRRLWLWTFCIFLGKLLLNGAEYVIVVYIVAFVPLFFYRRAKGWTGLRKDALAIFCGLTLAMAAATLILGVQISISDSPAAALHHFEDRVLTRTYFPTPGNPDYYYHAMEQSIGEVIITYFTINAVSIRGFHVPFWAFFVAFLAVTPFSLFIARRRGHASLRSLVYALWLCFAAVWAWIIILKGHSAAHTFTDPLMFDLPFSFLGFLLVFATIRALMRRAPVHGSHGKGAAPASAPWSAASAPGGPPAHSLVHDNKL